MKSRRKKSLISLEDQPRGVSYEIIREKNESLVLVLGHNSNVIIIAMERLRRPGGFRKTEEFTRKVVSKTSETVPELIW